MSVSVIVVSYRKSGHRSKSLSIRCSIQIAASAVVEADPQRTDLPEQFVR
jgi:hypothetical protein